MQAVRRPGASPPHPGRHGKMHSLRPVYPGLHGAERGRHLHSEPGVLKEIATPYHEPSTVCVGCGACANVCPTEAIPLTETAETRTIWGKTFQLVRCASCGRILGTREELELAAKRCGQEPETLCERCRKAATAQILADVYGD